MHCGKGGVLNNEQVHKGRGINLGKRCLCLFSPSPLPNTSCDPYSVPFCSPKDSSANRDLGRAKSQQATCQGCILVLLMRFNPPQTEVSSALFSTENDQAGGLVRLFAN